MNLICNKQPRRATGLTVGNEYVGRMTMQNGETTDNMDNAKHFYCTNDRGRDARYSIGLFIEPVEPEPIVVPNITYDDVVAKMEYNMSINNNDITLIVKYEDQELINASLVKWSNDSLSCGITAITRIGSLVDCVNDIEIAELEIEGSNLVITEDDLKDLKVIIFRELMTRLLVNNQLDLGYAFAMISDNDIDSEIHWDVLDEMSITDVNQNHKVNPNSGNEIKFWVIPLTIQR